MSLFIRGLTGNIQTPFKLSMNTITKKNMFLLAVAAGLFLLCGTAQAEFAKPVAASAEQETWTIDKTIQADLTEESPAGLHPFNTANNISWLASCNWTTGQTRWITYQLGADLGGGNYEKFWVDKIYLWQYSYATQTHRQLKDFDIYASEDGGGIYTQVGETRSMTQHTSGSIPAQTFDVGALATHIKLIIKSNQSATPDEASHKFVGLGEFRFEKGQIPNYITLGVSRSLPVYNETMEIKVVDFYSHGASGPASFYAEDPNGQIHLVGTESLVEPIICQWIPNSSLGLHKLWCEINSVKSNICDVFVTNRLLHFSYWVVPPTQKWATVGGLNADLTSSEAARRGIVKCVWRLGSQESATLITEQDYVDYWSSSYPEIPGIILDEFNGNGHPRDVLPSQALILLRQQYPDMFVGPYTIGVSDSNVVDGFRSTSLVHLETYGFYFGQYHKFGSYLTACNEGIGDKTLITIGLSPPGVLTYTRVNHEIELRRQFSYLRTNYPDMPGMALFSNGTETMMEAVDRAIYDYFLGPAVLSSLDGNTVNIANIGQLPAESVRVIFENSSGGESVETITIIEAGDTNGLTLPSGYTSARLEQQTGYTVVNYTSPMDIQFDAAAAEATRIYMCNFENFAEPLLGDVVWDLTYDDSNDVEAASCNLNSNLPEGNFAFSFDVELGEVNRYGKVGVVLADSNGDGLIGLHWRRSDADDDLGANIPRAIMTFIDNNDVAVTEAIAPGMNAPDKKQRFFIAYDDSHKVVRVMMFDKTSGILRWDTGFIPVEGSFNPDQLRCELTTAEGSIFQWNDATNRIYMQGNNNENYIIQSWVDNLKIMYGTQSHGDLDCSNFVDINDLFLFAQKWMAICNLQNNFCDGADYDNSNLVDFSDFAELANNWYTPCGGTAQAEFVKPVAASAEQETWTIDKTLQADLDVESPAGLHPFNTANNISWLASCNWTIGQTRWVVYQLGADLGGGNYEKFWVDKIYLWQYSYATQTYRQMKDFDIYASEDGGITYTQVGETRSMTIHTSGEIPAQTFDVCALATHIKLIVKSNQSTTPDEASHKFVGLGEFRFEKINQ